MIVAFNWKRPCQMRRFYEFLKEEGFDASGVTLLEPGEDDSCALKIDTERRKFVGKNPHYPGHDGDMYGAEIAINMDKWTNGRTDSNGNANSDD